MELGYGGLGYGGLGYGGLGYGGIGISAPVIAQPIISKQPLADFYVSMQFRLSQIVGSRFCRKHILRILLLFSSIDINPYCPKDNLSTNRQYNLALSNL